MCNRFLSCNSFRAKKIVKEKKKRYKKCCKPWSFAENQAGCFQSKISNLPVKRMTLEFINLWSRMACLSALLFKWYCKAVRNQLIRNEVEKSIVFNRMPYLNFTNKIFMPCRCINYPKIMTILQVFSFIYVSQYTIH